jgi:heterodisulfide reductase subunit A2
MLLSLGREQEREARAESPRIGVFVCHCGHNIAGYVDVPALVRAAGELPHVVHVHDSLFACSDGGLAEIREAIAEQRLNRVVVASCTPRTHEALFQANCAEAGLNRYLFEFVNIRDQCSWVHMEDRERATQKAKDLIRMGVAKAALLQPLQEAQLSIQPTAAVIGGGIAGMTAALSLARRGFGVTLIEREPDLGGILRHLDVLYPTGLKASQVVERYVTQIAEAPQIEVWTSAEVREVKGYLGNYELLVRNPKLRMDLPVQAGVIIVATGADEYLPVGLYGYGEDPRAITQKELEERLVGENLPDAISSVVMIQCVAARNELHSYCGRTCCLTAMKNAMLLKRRDPQTRIYVLYRDIEVYGMHFEDYYGQARELGVLFIRFDPEDPPHVADGYAIVYDELLGARLRIPYDLLVLSTPMVPRPGARELAQKLKVPVDEYGFFLEAHVKLRPLDFATDGVYLCGSAHWPAHLDEAISQAYGAASRAATILSKDQIQASGIVARVEESLCRGCERCAEVCEFGAIDFVAREEAGGLWQPWLSPAQPTPDRRDEGAGKVARINPVLCKGCGACAVVCPTSALQACHFTSEQVTAMVRAAVGG